MLEELMQKAYEKKAEIEADENATERDKQAIDMVVQFLVSDNGFDTIPKSTIYDVLYFLGYKYSSIEYDRMYKEAREELHKTYVYVDPADLQEWCSENDD